LADNPDVAEHLYNEIKINILNENELTSVWCKEVLYDSYFIYFVLDYKKWGNLE